MSNESFLVAGDQVIFTPVFAGTGLLMAPAMTIVISKSKNTASFRGITVEGDEKLWISAPCPYVNPPFIIPGMVICKIKKLHNSHIAEKIKENTKRVLLVGSGFFEAEFQVISPAKQPPPSNAPDTTPMYPAKGQFVQTLDSKALYQG